MTLNPVQIDWSNTTTIIAVCAVLAVVGIAALLVRDRSRWD